MKRTIKNRVITILLTLALTIGLFPSAAFARNLETGMSGEASTKDTSLAGGSGSHVDRVKPEPDGAGTEKDPYLLTSAAQLIWFAEQVNSGKTDICAKIMNNIDLNHTAWTAIGSEAAPYAGVFDGGNFAVSNFTVSGNGKDQGFFGCCDHAEIKGLTTQGSSISGAEHVGGIVGNAAGGSITNCVNGSTISSDGVYNGGIAGICSGTTIKNCVNNGSIIKGTYQNGGIVGHANGCLIDQCVNNGNISNTDHSGGIAAYNVNGTVSNCLNTGNISTTGTVYCYTGGIVANNVGTASVVKNCLNLGQLSGAGGHGCRVNTIVCANDERGTYAENCYSLEGLGENGLAKNSASVTSEQLKSGYVAWMLNEKSAGVWKQGIGEDEHPSFQGDPVFPQGDGNYGSVCDHANSVNKPTHAEGAICSICGQTIPALGHSFGTEWKSDENSHWHECSCGEKSEFAPHSWDAGVFTTPPTCTQAGVSVYTCTVCGRTKTEVAPALGHSFGTEWESDENSHWHECSCGEKSESAPHSWDEGAITTPPTCTQAGVKTYTCTVCGRTKTEAVPALGHSWNAPVIEFSEDGKTAAATVTCKNDASHKEDLQVTVTGRVKVPATIEAMGITTYTASVQFEGKTYTATKDVQDIPKLKPAEITEKVVLRKLTDVPEALKNTPYNTVEKIEKAMEKAVFQKIGELNAGNVKKTLICDAVLMITENGVTRPATREEVEARGGITVVIPYPAGTDKTDFVFAVAHMLSADMDGMGAGDIEMPEITLTDDGLKVTLRGLSPVMVGYSKKAVPAEPTEPTVPTVPAEPDTPVTGDPANVIGWIGMMALAATGIAAVLVMSRKKKTVE